MKDLNQYIQEKYLIDTDYIDDDYYLTIKYIVDKYNLNISLENDNSNKRSLYICEMTKQMKSKLLPVIFKTTKENIKELKNQLTQYVLDKSKFYTSNKDIYDIDIDSSILYNTTRRAAKTSHIYLTYHNGGQYKYLANITFLFDLMQIRIEISNNDANKKELEKNICLILEYILTNFVIKH